MKLLLVFCLTFGDKRSTFSRENKHRRNYTGVFVTMKKKVLPKFEVGSLDSKSKVLTSTPWNLMNLVLLFCLTFGNKRSAVSRENKHRRNYTGVFVTTEKRGSIETRTRVFGFKVQGANHYTMEPVEFSSFVLLDFWRQAFYTF